MVSVSTEAPHLVRGGPAKLRGDACVCDTGTIEQPLTSQKSTLAVSSSATTSTSCAGLIVPFAFGNISSRLSRSWSSSCTEASACESSSSR